MNALDELKAKYVNGSAVTEIEFVILMSERCVGMGARKNAASELARLQAEIQRLRKVEAERDALRKAAELAQLVMENFLDDATRLDDPKYSDKAWSWFKNYAKHFQVAIANLAALLDQQP